MGSVKKGQRRCETKVCSRWLQIDFPPHLQKQIGKADRDKQTDLAYIWLQNRKNRIQKKTTKRLFVSSHTLYFQEVRFFYTKIQKTLH